MTSADRVQAAGTSDARQQAHHEFELIHAHTLRSFPELVRELGGDPEALLFRAGIDPAILARRGARLSYRAMAALLEMAAAELNSTDFGMRLATLQGGGRVFGPMGVVMRNSRTLGEALEYVVDHVHAYSPAVRIRHVPNPANGNVLVQYDPLLDQLSDARQAIEQTLLLGQLNAIETTGGRSRAHEVLFRHPPQAPAQVYRNYFGCAVRFDQRVAGIVFTAQDFACPIVKPDAQLHEMATSFIATRFARLAPPLAAEVRGLVLGHLGGQTCTEKDIAAELSLHPRTLRRRLRAEGKSFEGVKDAVRRDMAQFYLRHTDLPVMRIAEKLGYAESSVLTRSCARWFARTPREFRRCCSHS